MHISGKKAVENAFSDFLEAKLQSSKFICSKNVQYNAMSLLQILPQSLQGSFFSKFAQNLSSEINRDAEIRLEDFKRALYCIFQVENLSDVALSLNHYTKKLYENDALI